MPKTEKSIPDSKECGRIKKTFLIVAGVVSIALGGIGVFLPLLPTTPFVLLAAGCFAGSSPAMHRWLCRSRFFGEYIENYRTNAGVSKSIKIRAIVFLWAGLALSAAAVHKPLVRVILAVVGICVSTHLLMMKAKDENKETC
ncbi:MAG: YbaN family protein [Synergistaceae bacterium]|nr:YbaN family protein [Synergistaceae bacterium]